MNKREKSQTVDTPSISLDSSIKKRNVENVINEIRFLRNRLSEMSPSPTSPGIPKSQPASSLKLSSHKEDSLFSKFNESQLITDKIKSQLQQSQLDFSFQLDQIQEEQKRKGDIDKGFTQVADDVRSLASLMAELREKDNKIREKEKEIWDRDNKIGEKEKEIAEKSTEILEKDSEIRQRDRELKEKDTELNKSRALTSSLQDEIRQRERELKEKDTELNKLRVLNSSLQDETRQKEKELKEREIELSKSWALLSSLQDEKKQRERELKEKDTELSKSRVLSSTLQDEIRQKERELKEKDTELSKSKALSSNLQEKVQKLENTVTTYSKQLTESTDIAKQLSSQLEEQETELQIYQQETLLLEQEVQIIQEKYSQCLRDLYHIERTIENERAEEKHANKSNLLENDEETLQDLIHKIQQKLDLLHAYKEIEDKRKYERDESDLPSSKDVNYLLREVEKREWEIDKLKSSIRK